MIDTTHDPTRTSWVASANGHIEFPIQNLPFGVSSVSGGAPLGGVAIGDAILDIGAALASGLFSSTDASGIGCLLKMTFGGRDTITLNNGETRRYLEDGDEVTFRAHCRRAGAATIGFGECTGRIVAD